MGHWGGFEAGQNDETAEERNGYGTKTRENSTRRSFRFVLPFANLTPSWNVASHPFQTPIALHSHKIIHNYFSLFVCQSRTTNKLFGIISSHKSQPSVLLGGQGQGQGQGSVCAVRYVKRGWMDDIVLVRLWEGRYRRQSNGDGNGHDFYTINV